jgi:hypothetical protein
MSKGTFLGKLFRSPFISPLGSVALSKDDTKEKNAANDAVQATKVAKAKTKTDAAALQKSQNAKQFAAANTTSKGFGSNSLDNLSRSFLLRL